MGNGGLGVPKSPPPGGPLPISDNNVSTTNDSPAGGLENDWEVTDIQTVRFIHTVLNYAKKARVKKKVFIDIFSSYLQMSAVTSGVHGNHESLGTPRSHIDRLNNKKKLVAKRSSNPASIPPMLGDINRSIEKMSLEAPPPPPQQV